MTTESKDRAALRNLAIWVESSSELLATVPRPQGGHSRTLLDSIQGGRAWKREVDAMLAQPDPAQELAEALRQCLRHLEQDAQGLLAGKAARAALAKYEGSKL